MYLGMESLSHMVTVRLFEELSGLFSKAAAPFYILSSNVWGLQFLHILNGTYYCLDFLILVILVGVKWYLDMYLPDVEHFVLCLLAICVSS